MCRHVQSVHGRLVTLVLSHSATEVFLRVAVASGLDEARDLVLADAGRRDAL